LLAILQKMCTSPYYYPDAGHPCSPKFGQKVLFSQ
jgi:hypothetical protein